MLGLLSVSRTHSAVWGSVGMCLLVQRLSPKVRSFFYSAAGEHPRVSLYPGLFVHGADEFHRATEGFGHLAHRDEPDPTTICTEGGRFNQKRPFVLRCAPGAYNRLQHGDIVEGDDVVEVATFAHEGL